MSASHCAFWSALLILAMYIVLVVEIAFVTTFFFLAAVSYTYLLNAQMHASHNDTDSQTSSASISKEQRQIFIHELKRAQYILLINQML